MKINSLVLASSSPYRRQILEKAGIQLYSAEPQADESSIPAQGLSPKELARARSNLKGLSLAQTEDSFLAIAADQVLDFEGQAYGKAYSREEAHSRLTDFQGKTHQLHSAYSLVFYAANERQLLCSRIVTATLVMRPLTQEEIAAYVATDEWQGCAGCYQYENKGIQLFDHLDGDLSTVIGLSMPALLKDLRALGINPLVQAQGPWLAPNPWPPVRGSIQPD